MGELPGSLQHGSVTDAAAAITARELYYRQMVGYHPLKLNAALGILHFHCIICNPPPLPPFKKYSINQ